MGAEPARRGPGRPRSNASEESILAATLELLVEKGYRGLTIDGVAGQARVSKSTIYRRWESKEALILAAFDKMPDLQPPNTGNLEDDLLGILNQFIGFVRNTSLSTVLPILIGECAHNPALMAALNPLVERRREPTRAILRAALERGEIKRGGMAAPFDQETLDLEAPDPEAPDLDTLVDIVIGPILLRLFFVQGDLSDQAVRRIVRTALQGSLAR